VKQTKLTKEARDKPCQVRLIDVCNFNTATTCLRHIRRGGVAGGAQKPPDTCGVWACYDCDSLIPDGRPKGIATDGDILDALCRTLFELHKLGYRLVRDG